MSIRLPARVSVCLSVYLSVSLVFLSVCLSFHLSSPICMSVSLLLCRSVRPSVFLNVYMSRSSRLSVCPSFCPFDSQSFHRLLSTSLTSKRQCVSHHPVGVSWPDEMFCASDFAFAGAIQRFPAEIDEVPRVGQSSRFHFLHRRSQFGFEAAFKSDVVLEN